MRPVPRADCGFNQVAPLQLTPSSALEHVENADTLGSAQLLRIGELPLDPLENKIGTRQTLAVLPQSGSKRTFTRSRLGAQIDPMQTFRADCLLKTRGRPVSPWAATHQPRSRITHFIRPRPMLVCRRFSKEPKQKAKLSHRDRLQFRTVRETHLEDYQARSV